MYHPTQKQTFTSYFQQMQPDVPLMAFQQVNLNVNAKEYESPKHQRKQKNVMSSTMHNNALCSPITLNKCSNINSNTNIIKANAKIIEVYEDNFIKEIKKLSQSYKHISSLEWTLNSLVLSIHVRLHVMTSIISSLKQTLTN